DELVQLELVVPEMAAHRLRRMIQLRGADGFVRILRGLARLEHVGLAGDEGRPVAAGDVLAQGGDRVWREARGVRAHVRDEPDGTPVLAQVHALVEPLRALHGALRAEAETIHGILLELARGVGSGRVWL